MLIRRAQCWPLREPDTLSDVRLRDGRIAAMGELTPQPGERQIEAEGGLLLPGLHDQHIHLFAEATARQSLPCGPPDVRDAEALVAVLRAASGESGGSGWLRGVGYHESVAGMLDAAAIDAMVAGRPVRIQHRSGRMWFFNSAALDVLLAAETPPEGLERINGRWTGRLFDDDGWMRRAIGGSPPCLRALSTDLARCGVTGVTDMSVANDPATVALFAGQQADGRLSQRLVLAGQLALAEVQSGSRQVVGPMLTVGPAKLHLHEWQLPDLDECVGFIRAAHAQGRAVATHCTTEVELVFALAALEAAGVRRGDRIEHAGMASDALVQMVADRALIVVSQPQFIAERGDAYIRDVPVADHAQLYRLATFAGKGVTLAAGSDAPYGGTDPWAAMRAAVSRRTRDGVLIGPDEALTPEAALALYLADPEDLTRQRAVTVGAAADLCLLDRPWRAARERLLAEDVRVVMIGGSIVHERIDQAPV